MNICSRLKPVMTSQRGSSVIRDITHVFIYILGICVFCEYVIYYVVLMQCTWPQLDDDPQPQKPLKIALISDTHLLGPRHGHWFDKSRREWQMYRSFQTMMSIHSPSAIFFLGDLFDEGLWSDEMQFNYYVQRFHTLFKTTEDVQMHVVAGNHDIGFHYSMAMERDDCFLCEEAKAKLKELVTALKCAKDNASLQCESVAISLPKNTRPVLLQHFPMYRVSDALCEGPDAAPLHEKQAEFREGWECLSKESTDLLLDQLKPRLVFGGHTHHGCFVMHKDQIPEWSIPSFSWRNRNNPSYMLLTLTPEKYALTKCFLPQEFTVVSIYITSAILLFLWLTLCKCRIYYRGIHVKHR